MTEAPDRSRIKYLSINPPWSSAAIAQTGALSQLPVASFIRCKLGCAAFHSMSTREKATWAARHERKPIGFFFEKFQRTITPCDEKISLFIGKNAGSQISAVITAIVFTQLSRTLPQQLSSYFRKSIQVRVSFFERESAVRNGGKWWEVETHTNSTNSNQNASHFYHPDTYL